MSTTMLHVRMDEDTKDQAHAALKAMGLTVSEAVRVFLHKVAAEQALPFEIRAPNAATDRRARHASATALTAGRATKTAKPKAPKPAP